jgi:hypothetical protein
MEPVRRFTDINANVGSPSAVSRCILTGLQLFVESSAQWIACILGILSAIFAAHGHGVTFANIFLNLQPVLFVWNRGRLSRLPRRSYAYQVDVTGSTVGARKRAREPLA